jgi:Ca2+-dependent lipid-binding protein
MKNHIILIQVILLIFFASLAGAEDFLGAPIIPYKEKVQKTYTRLKLLTDLSHDDAVAFYREAFKDEKDIKFRDWKNATYIEDDGNREWHSVTISKDTKGGATVTITKDSWSWILGMLAFRFLSVFIVLCVLFMGMKISTAIILKVVGKISGEKA